jgi:diguanylate cyclase (GGDEF)-like protein/PAS domain S-box-containing protein
METESEPYVRLASLRELHQVVADLTTARSLADTLQAVVDGVVRALGYELAAVNLVRPDGDLIVAAVAGSASAEALMAGRVGSRASWDRWLEVGERWGTLRFVPHTDAWILEGDQMPIWRTDGPPPRHPNEWHPDDLLLAPMYSNPSGTGELIGVLSVDGPVNGLRPDPWACEALQMYAFQAAVAITNARLRANMQRALVRLEREQQAMRASEESFRQAFEYAPSGMAIAEMGGDQHGRLIRANDALCRLLGRPAAVMRRYSFSDLVHPEDVSRLLRTSAEGGRVELRLQRRDGTYVWVSLRNSVVADAADGPRFLLTHVEDIEERKSQELALAHRASHDSLTGLPNSAELRTRLSDRLCRRPQEPDGAGRRIAGDIESPDEFAYTLGYGPDEMGAPMAPAGRLDHHTHTITPDAAERIGEGGDGAKGLAVLFCDLDGFKLINDRYGHNAGDVVLIEVARRLTSGVRDGDTVARLGGDEFVVLADGLGREDAEDLAARLRNAILPPIRVDGRTVRVGASFGIGWAGCGMTAEEILESADQRMYIEKRSRSTSRNAHRRAG